MRNLKTPFSLGPINGGLPWPPGYGSASREKEWIRFFRWLYTYLPFLRSTYSNPKAVIVGSSYTYLATGRRVERNRLFFIHQNGIFERDVLESRRYDDIPPVRVCFLGRLVPLKNCNIVIRSAAALIRERKIRLDIVGDGWDRRNLEALTRDLGLEKDVTFHGWLPHPQAMGILAGSDVMALPTIREFGGGVVVEAMARGVVPIVMRYGGPSDLVEEGYGISLALKNESDTVQDLERVLERAGKKSGPDQAAGRGCARQSALDLYLGKEDRASGHGHELCHGGRAPARLGAQHGTALPIRLGDHAVRVGSRLAVTSAQYSRAEDRVDPDRPHPISVLLQPQVRAAPNIYWLEVPTMFPIKVVNR